MLLGDFFPKAQFRTDDFSYIVERVRAGALFSIGYFLIALPVTIVNTCIILLRGLFLYVQRGSRVSGTDDHAGTTA